MHALFAPNAKARTQDESNTDRAMIGHESRSASCIGLGIPADGEKYRIPHLTEYLPEALVYNRKVRTKGPFRQTHPAPYTTLTPMNSATASSEETRLGSWGLPEFLGITVALVCLAWWSPVEDYVAGPKLLILLAGGLGALPAVIYRWRAGQTPQGAPRIVIAATAGLVVWATLSMLLSGAPLATSLFGWWGRANGWLSLIGAFSLMLAAATLRRDEIARVITWLLVGAVAVSVVGLAQLAGNQVVGGQPNSGLIATMGNINFSGAYFAIMSILAAGRALTSHAPSWQRIGAGALAAVLVALSILTTSAQGPAAIGAGALATLVLWALAYRGERRRAALGVAGALTTISVATLLVSFAGIGPLAGLWQDVNFRVRQGTWLTAWEIAQAMPIFGTGPDGLQRFAAQYAPDSYVELVGTQVTLSAAHNVPLQYAATLGILAGALWLITMVGAIVLLLVTMARHPIPDAVVAASVGGAFVAYLTQAMVSIDMTGLLATGWLLLGLTVALCLPAATKNGTTESRLGATTSDAVDGGHPADARQEQSSPLQPASATRSAETTQGSKASQRPKGAPTGSAKPRDRKSVV